MLTTRWNSFAPESLAGVRREFDEAVNQLLGSTNARRSAGFEAPLTIWEDDEHIFLEVDVPGLQKEHLDLTFQEGQLWIRGERSVPRADGKYWHNERMFGRFERMVRLPDTVDAEKIDAELCDGVLFLTLNKLPEAQPHKITVKAGRGNKRISKS